MEIMDKYVEAGEALAEKENDVRQLTKQVSPSIAQSHSDVSASRLVVAAGSVRATGIPTHCTTS